MPASSPVRGSSFRGVAVSAAAASVCGAALVLPDVVLPVVVLLVDAAWFCDEADDGPGCADEPELDCELEPELWAPAVPFC